MRFPLIGCLLFLTISAQQRENRIQQSAGGQTTVYQHSSTYQSSSGPCCQQNRQPQPQPQYQQIQQSNQCCQSQQVQSQPIRSQSTTKTWHISGFTAELSPQSNNYSPVSTTNVQNVEYRNQEGENGGETLKVDYNQGRCVDTITENGAQRSMDYQTKAKFRNFANQLNHWHHQIKDQMGSQNQQQSQNQWNLEPKVPDCPCSPQFCGSSAQNQQNLNQVQNYPRQPSYQNQQTWQQPGQLNLQSQQSHGTNSYEFRYDNGRCILKDGVVTEDGRNRALNYEETRKLENFKQAFDRYTKGLHDQMKQKMNTFLNRDNNRQTVQVENFQPQSPPEPPCLCSEAICGRQS